MKVLVAMVFSVLVAWAPITFADTTIRVANWLPASHLLVKNVLVPWGEAVEEATSGSVQVKIMSSALGPPSAQYDLVANGLADVGFSTNAYTPGRFTVFELAELPLQTPSAEALSVAYWRTYDKLLPNSKEYERVHLLTLFVHGPGQIWNSVRPIKTLDDLQGLKLRVPGGVAAELAERLGAVPVSAPSSQSYQLLSSGVADGILFPFETVTFFSLEDILHYGSTVPGGFYNTAFYVVMNKAKWDSLTDAQREAINDVSGEVLARQAGEAWDAADRKAHEVLKAAGVDIQPVGPGVLKTLQQEAAALREQVLERVANTGADGQAFLQELHRQTEAVDISVEAMP